VDIEFQTLFCLFVFHIYLILYFSRYSFFYAVANCEDVCIITNGKLKDKAIAIARLSDVCENFNSQLSQDQFHDPIDVEVIKAFGDRIRDTSNNLACQREAPFL
jgi:hypothetical protein